MHLAMTALEQFWDKSKNILFLGEWCKLYRRKEIWGSLSYETLPYHWDDREKYLQDYLHADRLYEEYLDALAVRLNEIHHTKKTLRYWRIVIGPWLYLFIEIFLDRYLSSRAAAASGKVTSVWICKVPDSAWTPLDMDEFTDWYMGDSYNQYLYSWIIFHLGIFPFETVMVNTGKMSGQVKKRATPQRWHRKWAKKAMETLAMNGIPRIVFVKSFLNIWCLAMLQLYMGQIPCLLFPGVKKAPVEIDDHRRSLLKLEKEGTELVDLLSRIIPQQIPLVYIEGYNSLKKASQDAFPRKPKLIVTANAHFNNDAFKLWAASHTESRIPLVTAQHGGLHGSGLISSNEKHEIAIADCHYTWGWSSDDNNKVRPMPSGKLWCDIRKIRPDPDGIILWVATSCSRYAYSMLSMVIGPQMIAYYEDQKRFLKNLIPQVKDLVVLRLFLYEYGWDEGNRWRDLDPELKIYDGTLDMLTQLKKSRLFVGTYNSTNILQSLAADFPSVLFWNPCHWEIRPQAKPYFQALRKVDPP